MALLLENLSVFNVRKLAAFLHGEPTRSPTPSPVRIQVWQIQPAVSFAARLGLTNFSYERSNLEKWK
jgi:hypothetical protein